MFTAKFCHTIKLNYEKTIIDLMFLDLMYIFFNDIFYYHVDVCYLINFQSIALIREL